MKRRSAVGVSALIVAALLVGAIGGYVASAATSRSTASDVAELGDGKPHIVSTGTLSEVAPLLGVAYWAGDRPRTKIELTLTDAAVYLRYLPTTSPVGRSTPALTVATYREIAGYESLSSQSGVTKARSGALIAVEKSDPLSTYFAFPSATFEVEVYSPAPGESKKLVNDGSITPIPSR